MPGSTSIIDWRWHYSSNSSGSSVPFTYLRWASEQPNNWKGNQFVVSLQRAGDFDFNDEKMSNNFCYLCECSDL